MIESVRKDILNILREVTVAFNVYDASRIMELSDHIIHSASVYQDKYSIQAATFVYALGKVIAKGKVRRFPQDSWEDFKATVKRELSNAKSSLLKNKLKQYDQSIRVMQASIKKLDSSFKQYVETVIDKAKLKKGAKIYEHGVSLRRVSEMLGVSEWDLMGYVGKTKILDREKHKSKVKERLELARKVFE